LGKWGLQHHPHFPPKKYIALLPAKRLSIPARALSWRLPLSTGSPCMRLLSGDGSVSFRICVGLCGLLLGGWFPVGVGRVCSALLVGGFSVGSALLVVGCRGACCSTWLVVLLRGCRQSELAPGADPRLTANPVNNACERYHASRGWLAVLLVKPLPRKALCFS